jgi:hypothetical protein
MKRSVIPACWMRDDAQSLDFALFHLSARSSFRALKTTQEEAMKKTIGIIIGICLLSLAHAEVTAPKFTVPPLAPTQRIFIDNINLTAREFFLAYMSKSVEERRYAELYLLGVLDSTEGTAWCSYRTFITAIDEDLYLGFKELENQKQDKRAAQVIAEILSKEFPCGGKTK